MYIFFILQQEVRFIIWWCFNQYLWLVLFLANLDENPIYCVRKRSPFSIQQMEKIVLLSLMFSKNLWCQDFYLNFFKNNHSVFIFKTWNIVNKLDIYVVKYLHIFPHLDIFSKFLEGLTWKFIRHYCLIFIFSQTKCFSLIPTLNFEFLGC